MITAPGYRVWLGAATVSELGTNVMAFAIAWTAAGYGGTAAGLVATSAVVFRVVLLIAGGSVGDRVGPRKVMIACDGTMLLITGIACAWYSRNGASVVSLLLLGCCLGIVSAFYLPAAGVFPRLFVPDADLGRVMATTSSALQLARISGPALGGVLLAAIGLAWVVFANAGTFLVIAVVLVLVVPPRPARAPEVAHVNFRQAWATLRQAGQHRVLVSLLVALAALSAGGTSVLVLGIPLLSRSRGWSATNAGFIEAAFMAAALGVGLGVATRGTLRRNDVALIGGPALAGVALIAVAVAPSAPLACAASAAVGVGIVLFATHALPFLLAASPAGMQVRLQALLSLAQALPVLVVYNVYGAIAQHASPSWALIAGSIPTITAGIVVLLSRPRLERSAHDEVHQ